MFPRTPPFDYGPRGLVPRRELLTRRPKGKTLRTYSMAANPNGITGVHDEARTTAPAYRRGSGLTKKVRVDREVDRVKGAKGKCSETEL